MLFSVRCVTCNKAIGGKWERYKTLVVRYALEGHEAEKFVDSTTTVSDFKGLSSKDMSTAEDEALRALGVNRYCCRRHFMTDIDLLEGDEVAKVLAEGRQKDADILRRRRLADSS